MLSGPESVLYDADQDMYFVSNVNGGATVADDNGYISRIRASDGAIEPTWINGKSESVTLNAPKGLAMDERYIWVADIDTVRRFDRKTGEPARPIAVPGSIFLNAMARGDDGSFYVSDSGLAGEQEGESPERMDAVYRITSDEKVETIVQSQDLLRPNGLVYHDGDLWTVTFGDAQIYRVTAEGKRDVQALPARSLDGVVRLPGGDFLISSWDANGIFRGPADRPFRLVLEELESPADIEFDSTRNLLLVPGLMANRISIFPVDPGR